MKQSDLSQKQTENKLGRYFEELKKENYEDTFHNTQTWLLNLDSQLSLKNNFTERILIKMKNFLSLNKFRLAYTFIILAFVVAACNYPVSQEENLGDVISWTVNKNDAGAVEKIKQLDWLKSGTLSINEKNIGGADILEYSFVIPKDKHGKAAEMKNRLGTLQGINSVKLIPLNETVKRPLYSAALNSIFKIDINATNMSDEELQKEIITQLANNGITGVQIEFEKGKEGRRISKINIPETGIKEEGGFDMTINDGNNVERIKQVRKKDGNEEEKFKGKSDKEIKKMVMEDLKDKNITEDMIEVIRDGDKVMIKIKADFGNSDRKELELKQK